jgi:hypothetical protein
MVVARRCSAVADADAGSSRIAAATSRPAPAITSKARPPADPGPSAIASPTRANPTTTIANSTAKAAARPGTASRLIVLDIGS